MSFTLPRWFGRSKNSKKSKKETQDSGLYEELEQKRENYSRKDSRPKSSVLYHENVYENLRMADLHANEAAMMVRYLGLRDTTSTPEHSDSSISQNYENYSRIITDEDQHWPG